MIMKSYSTLHTHSCFSILDSTSHPEDIIKTCVDMGINAIAFTEHGNISSWMKKKKLCEKYGIKYIHGIEMYMTEQLEPKVRDNYHVVLLAKNYSGVEEINELYSISTSQSHMYYNPRITIDEFLATSDNIIRLSGCLGGILNKMDESNPRYKEVLDKFDYLEIQPHMQDEQKEYNKRLLLLNKPLVATGDFHEISKYKSECRMKWMKGKGKEYEEYDLIMKNRDDFRESFKLQGVLSDVEIDKAIDETNNISNRVEDFDVDTSFKFPDLYENASSLIYEKTYGSLNNLIDSGIVNEDDIDVYISRIETELEAFSVLKMESFILFMSELISYAKDNDIAVGYGRGSVTGSLVCYLLNISDVDPIIWGTNFTRFINVNRISLPDIDTDIAPEDRNKVFNYIRDRFGIEQSSYIATYQKLGVKKIVEDISRAIGLPIPEMEEIKSGYGKLEKEEQILNRAYDDCEISQHEYNEKSSILEKKITDYLSKFRDVFYYYEGLKGTISATGFHPAGMIGSPINIKKSIGLRYYDKTDGWISSCDMKEVDGVNYVKYDILSLNTMQIIKHAFKLIGRKMPRSIEMDWGDAEVFAHIQDSPIGIFQFESSSSWEYLKRFNCKSVRDIAFVTAIIRPSCASFRDRAIDRIKNINPNEKIDEVLKDSLGYLVYQEQQISFLQKLCGFSEGQADIVRRAIGKKDAKLLAEWLPKIESGYVENSKQSEDIAKNECKAFMKVFIDASDYSFSYNHAIAYSMITYMTAWLRYHYPTEFITSYLNNAVNEEDIQDGQKLAELYGIKINNPLYGRSSAKYSILDGEINKGVGSILNMSNEAGNKMMELSREFKDLSFIELLDRISELKILDSTKTTVLIRLNYFSMYGNNKKLDAFYNIYKEYKGKKVVKKDAVIPKFLEKIIKNNSTETTKQYRIDSEAVIKEVWDKLPNVKYSNEDNISFQLSYLTYIQDKDLMSSNLCRVLFRSRTGDFCMEDLAGNRRWFGIDSNLLLPEKDSYVYILSTGRQKNGKYTKNVILNYETIKILRNKRKKG